MKKENNTITLTAPPYHVQSNGTNLRQGFPYFTHHDSVSALWSKKWRAPCAAGIYPFTDGKIADFDAVFAELQRISNDDPSVLYRPDASGPSLESTVKGTVSWAHAQSRFCYHTQGPPQDQTPPRFFFRVEQLFSKLDAVEQVVQ